jgi:hypothetical protein
VNLRRTLATASAGLALIAALAACGFNYPTDKVNQVTAGTNYRGGTVDVLNAAIVSKTDNLGTFIATFVNTSQKAPISVTSMAGDGTAISTITVDPFPVPPNGLVNLADGGGVPVQGTYRKGQFVTLSIQFDNGETATLEVPVVDDAGYWEGLDTATPSPTASPSDSTSPSSPSSPASPSATSSPSDTSSPSASAS